MANKNNLPVKKLEFGSQLFDWKIILIFVLINLAGVGTGYGISRLRKSTSAVVSGNGQSGELSPDEKVKVGQTYGSENVEDDIFPDEATGVIEASVDNVEGTHRLVREGGESQTVYLTSSLVDLDRFIDREVKVWGETFAAQRVGWLMDVGAVKVLK